ncbi:MAG TPA: DUF2911 domain-containing protein [Bryobacteraceae bacterium]|nr:DUF2911 domain-containing protein [Bryobacteraceae bacterium]
MVPSLNCGIVAALMIAAPLLAQQSPPAETSVTIAGKVIRINYSAPSMRGRKIFGGLEPYGRVWRAGANSATALHTDANLDIGGLAVPKGDYTLFVYLDPNQWQLVVSKETGEWGLDYNQSRDLGRVKMEMSKPPKPIETYKMTLSSQGANKGKLQLAWENTVADVPITVK